MRPDQKQAIFEYQALQRAMNETRKAQERQAQQAYDIEQKRIMNRIAQLEHEKAQRDQARQLAVLAENNRLAQESKQK